MTVNVVPVTTVTDLGIFIKSHKKKVYINLCCGLHHDTFNKQVVTRNHNHRNTHPLSRRQKEYSKLILQKVKNKSSQPFKKNQIPKDKTILPLLSSKIHKPSNNNKPLQSIVQLVWMSTHRFGRHNNTPRQVCRRSKEFAVNKIRNSSKS